MSLFPLLALLLSAELLAAPAPFLKRDNTPEDDMRLMAGTWDRLSCTGGSFPPSARPLNDQVEITPGKIVYQPGNFTWALTLGREKGKKTWDIRQGGNHWAGLYELKGDSLRVNFLPAAMRPNSIEPGKAGEFLQVFRRSGTRPKLPGK